jgi:hypothetical protein
MTIDKDKKYKTRNGWDVRIYATDGRDEYPVHGAIYRDNQWQMSQWRDTGSWSFGNGPMDLIEQKPACITYRNIYSHGRTGCLYDSKEMAIKYSDTHSLGLIEFTVDNGHVSVIFIPKDWKDKHDA